MKFLLVGALLMTTSAFARYDICKYEMIGTDGSIVKVTEGGQWTESACEEIAIRKLKNQEGEFKKLIIKYGKDAKAKEIDVKDIKTDPRGDYYL